MKSRSGSTDEFGTTQSTRRARTEHQQPISSVSASKAGAILTRTFLHAGFTNYATVAGCRWRPTRNAPVSPGAVCGVRGARRVGTHLSTTRREDPCSWRDPHSHAHSCTPHYPPQSEAPGARCPCAAIGVAVILQLSKAAKPLELPSEDHRAHRDLAGIHDPVSVFDPRGELVHGFSCFRGTEHAAEQHRLIVDISAGG